MFESPERLRVRRVAITSVVRMALPNEMSGSLRVLDLEHGRVSFVTPAPESDWRTVDPNPRGGTRGARGLSVHDGRLVIANAERLFVFDTAWRLACEISDPQMVDVHDVLAEGRGIWIAATGTDSLLLVGWDGRLQRVLTFRKNRRLLEELGFRERSLPRVDVRLDLRDPMLRGAGFDRLHVNSLGRSSQGILISFGRVRATEDSRPGVESALVHVTENGRRDVLVSILHRRSGVRVPNHNVAESGSLLVYNDSNANRLVAYDRARGEVRCEVPIPGSPAYARGLAEIGPDLWLVGSQAPFAAHAVDLRREGVVASYPLGGIQDEVVFGVCPLTDDFDDPRQPLGTDPYEFWKRAARETIVTPIPGGAR